VGPTPGAQRAAGGLVDGGQLGRLRPFPLLAPPAHLSLEESLGVTEVAQPDGLVVDRVDAGEHVDQLARARRRLLLAEPGDVLGRARDLTRDPLHHVEGRAVDGIVVAEGEGARHGHVGVGQRAEHPVLAAHIVRGRQHMAERRAAQDPVALTVGDDVGEVRLPARDELGGQRPVG